MAKLKSRRGKKGLMIVKLDLVKAYDRMEWHFINHVLEFFDFPSCSRRLIMHCVSSSGVSVLLNGGDSGKGIPPNLYVHYVPRIS